MILIIRELFLRAYFCFATSVMLKKVTASLLLLAFIASSFCRAVIVMDYYANSSVYARNCENKARPKMHCNGKCQMMKKLQQQEKQDQGNPERKTDTKYEVFFADRFALLTNLYAIAAARQLAPLLVQPLSDRAYPLLRPPSA